MALDTDPDRDTIHSIKHRKTFLAKYDQKDPKSECVLLIEPRFIRTSGGVILHRSFPS